MELIGETSARHKLNSCWKRSALSVDARDLLPIQSLLRSIDFDASSLPPILLILPPTNGSTGSNVKHSLKGRKEDDRVTICGHSKASRVTMCSTLHCTCVLLVWKTTHSLHSDPVVGGARKFSSNVAR